MEVHIGNLGSTFVDLSKVKKHQYDVLVSNYKKAKMNNHKDVTWLGVTYTLQYANYLIEYLDPKFKDML